jgi:polysulfide reductase chain C
MHVNWGLLVVLYLFLAGMAGGIYFTTAMYEFFNKDINEKIKKGYFYAFVLLLIAVFFLILDLERPARFIHMMFAYKFFSPMSMGSWGLFFFGLNAFITVCINSKGRLKALGDFFLRFLPYKAFILVGTALSIFLSAYTGVLLSETTMPLWSSTPFLGALFLTSGVSCGVCLLMLLNKDNEDFLKRGKILDNMCLIIELTVILFFILALTIGYVEFVEVKTIFTGLYGFLFIGLGIILGALIPLLINVSGKVTMLSPVLVLVGAFFLRYAIIFAGQIR